MGKREGSHNQAALLGQNSALRRSHLGLLWDKNRPRCFKKNQKGPNRSADEGAEITHWQQTRSDAGRTAEKPTPPPPKKTNLQEESSGGGNEKVRGLPEMTSSEN